MAGYHLQEISCGKFGELSKVYEEIEELRDAENQGAELMVLQELSDVLGAIRGYLAFKHPSLNINDLLKMSEITERAFLSGHRKSKND